MGEASFGKYRLIAELGHGGMADVFLAVQSGPAGSGFSKLTVVKRLRQNLADEPEFIEMLVDEARISARLNHPNVVQTNEVGSVGNVYFLAMEYLDGQPFHRIQHRATQFMQKAAAAAASAEVPAEGEPPPSLLLATDPFPKECSYIVLLDTLAGLHHAHELADYDGSPLQIVHRDVTPHNVFVTYEGQVKVVDFGIAKAAGRASETRQGVVKGKVRYMAPEQAIGQAVDRRADVFSVGVMLWEAATGRRLWKDMDDLNIVQALVGGDIKSSPREVDATIPEELDRICRKALAHSREDRYASAEDFRLDLEQFLADTGKLVSGRRILGAAVSKLFNDKRTEIRAVIEKQLQQLNKRSGDFRAVQIAADSASGSLSMPSSGAVAVSVGEGGLEPATSLTDASNVSMSGRKSARRREASFKSRIPMILVAGVAAVAIVALVVSRAPSQSAAARPVTSTSGAETTVPSEVRVRVTPSPANAQITIDGTLVGSPYDAKLPRSNREHLVRVEAPGFGPHAETVRFESDIALVVTLEKPTPNAAVSTTSQPPTSARWTPPPIVKSATSHEVPAPPPVTPPPPPTPPPASLGTKPANPKPAIDQGDPWNQH